MIQSVKRTLEILEFISANGNLVRLNDVAQALSLNKTTTHNFIKSLKELGYLEQDNLSPRYRITSKIQQLHPIEVSHVELKNKMRPLLEQLTQESGETAYLAVQLGSYFRYELKCEPERRVKISLELGKEWEMKQTAIGNVFMAHSHYLKERIGSDDPTFLNKLIRILDQGYALDYEEYEPELTCIAVPVMANQKVIAVVGLSGPAYRFNEEKMLFWANRLSSLLD